MIICFIARYFFAFFLCPARTNNTMLQGHHTPRCGPICISRPHHTHLMHYNLHRTKSLSSYVRTSYIHASSSLCIPLVRTHTHTLWHAAAACNCVADNLQGSTQSTPQTHLHQFLLCANKFAPCWNCIIWCLVRATTRASTSAHRVVWLMMECVSAVREYFG